MLQNPVGFRVAIFVAVILAGGAWWLCSVYTRMWNKQFQIKLLHHVGCAFVALLTMLFCILFASVQSTRDAAIVSTELWKVQLQTDQVWASQTFLAAYEKVKDLGIEDFSRISPSGGVIPTTKPESEQTAASVYVGEACRHFEKSRPFLSKVVWTDPGVPSTVVYNDISAWHRTNPNYSCERAINLAAEQIEEHLDAQTPRLVYVFRLGLIAALVVVQGIAFALVGWVASRDIRPHY
jgi:hypothetical protein